MQLQKFFEGLPWYIKGPAGICGGILSALADKFPPSLAPFVIVGGAALFIWVAVAFVWHAINHWRVEQGKAPFMLEPWHIIAVGLVIAVGGMIWQWRHVPTPDPQIAKLQSQVDGLTRQLAERPQATTSPKTEQIPKVSTATADIPKKLAAIDSLRRILNDEMLPWINSGQQLSTGGWWNWYVGNEIPHMQDVARNFFKRSQELDQEIQRVQNENVEFPDIHALASSPLGTPFLLRIEKLVTPILALPDDPSKKIGNDLYRFLFDPYAKETYAALNDVQAWRGATDRNALQLRQQLSQ